MTNLITSMAPAAPPATTPSRAAFGSRGGVDTVDLKKEIKLSDLVRRPKKTKTAGVTKPSSAKRKRRRKQEIVGLKIGASQLAAARVVNNGGRPQLVQLARSHSSRAIVVGGEVRDVAALAAALDELLHAAQLPRRGVRLGIAHEPHRRAHLRDRGHRRRAPARQRDPLPRARGLSIPVDEAVLDYHVVSEGVNEAGQRSRRVVLAAAYRDSIDRYVAACKEAGIGVVAVDLEASPCCAPSLLRPRATSRGAASSVTIGHNRTTLAISDGAICDFTRVLEWGGANLDTQSPASSA